MEKKSHFWLNSTNTIGIGRKICWNVLFCCKLLPNVRTPTDKQITPFELLLERILTLLHFWQPTMNSPKNCRFFRENLWISKPEPDICLFVQWFFLLLVYCFLCMNQILTLPDFHVFHKNDMHPHSTDCMSNSVVFCPTSHTWRM